jgi:hypothetical protein
MVKDSRLRRQSLAAHPEINAWLGIIRRQAHLAFWRSESKVDMRRSSTRCAEEGNRRSRHSPRIIAYSSQSEQRVGYRAR